MNMNKIMKYSSVFNLGLSFCLVLFKILKNSKLKKKNLEFEFTKLKKKKKNLNKYSYKNLDNIIEENELIIKNHPIYKICITGGPCAGKTTSLAMLSKNLTKYGFNVVIVPEVATLTVESGGCVIVGDKINSYAVERQSQIMKMIMKMEDYFYDLTSNKNDKPTVLLCDRGTLDGRAYVNDDVWRTIIDENNWNEIKLSHKRYNAIIHLVTAADGKKRYYTLENNAARSEGLNFAIEIDKSIQNSYAGHPKHIIIKNLQNQTFNEKINWVFEEVSGVIDLNINQKYSGNIEKTIYELKGKINFINLNIKTRKLFIKKIFLNDIIKKDKNGNIIEKQERYINIQKLNQEFNIYLNTSIITEKEIINKLKKINSKQFILYKKESSENYYKINIERESFVFNKRIYYFDQIKLDKPNSKTIYLLKRKNLKNVCCDDLEELPEDIVELIFKKVENNELFIAKNLCKKN